MKGQQQAKIIIIHEYKNLNLSKFLNPTLKTSIQPFPKIYKRSGHQRYFMNIQQIISGKGKSFQRDCCDIIYQERHRVKTDVGDTRTRRVGLNSISLPKRESCNKTSCIASRSLSKIGTPRHSSQNKRNKKVPNNMIEASFGIEQNKIINDSQQLRESQTSHKIYQNEAFLKNQSEQRMKKLIPIVDQSPVPTELNSKKQKNNSKDESCQTQISHFSLIQSRVKQNISNKQNDQIYQTPTNKKGLYHHGMSDSKISREELQQNLRNTKQKSIEKIDEKKKVRKQSSEEDNKSNSILEMSSGKVSSTIFHKIKQSMTKSAKKLRKGSTEKAYSVMSNGLFRIPEQDEFEDYLKGYKPLNPTFDMRQLVQSQNFHIVPTNNNVYFGEVINRKKNGKGITVSEKQIFEGAYRENSKITGSEKNRDGVYTGEFLKGKRHGKGKFIWNNGQSFQGEWRNGKKNGFGLWRSPRGDYYQGQWRDNRQNGKGYYVYFGGSKYKGQFKDFLKHGQGDEAFANGDRYTGQYQFGKPHGQGRYVWQNGDYYEGQFVNGSRQGRGKLVRKSGQIYEGQFKEDDKNGYGTQKDSKTGQFFKGQFRNGQRYQGKLKKKNTPEISINPK